MVWYWRTVQRLGRFVKSNQNGIISVTTPAVIGFVFYQTYDKLKTRRLALAEGNIRVSSCPEGGDTGADKGEVYLSGCTSGIKWDENWDR